MLLNLRSQYATTSPRAAADAVISGLSPAAWYRNATDVVSSGGFASIWADYASSDKGLVLPGVNSNYASAPDSAALDITDDFEIIVRCMANDYTPAAVNTFVGKWGSGTEAYRFYIDSVTGVLTFALQGISAYQSTVAPTCTDGTAYWFRVTRVRSTGKINFYQADDSATVPSSWTQVGTEVSGSTSAAASTAAVLSVGASGVTQTLYGTIYRAIIRSTIGGAAVFDADFSSQAIGTASFTESSSNAATVTINASGAAPAHIGKARDLLQGTGTNQPAYAAGVFTLDGADNWIRASTWSMVQPESVLIVGTQQTWTSGDSLCDGTTGNVMRLYQNNVTPQLFQYAGSSVSQNGGLSLNTRGIVLAVFNGASSSIRINNNAKTTGNAGAANGGGITVGAFGDTLSSFAHMTAEEIIVFPSALSDANQDAVITALNNALTVF